MEPQHMIARARRHFDRNCSHRGIVGSASFE
jgi:hypothetical protein